MTRGLEPFGGTTSGASRAGPCRQPWRAPDGARLHDERYRPERTTLRRLVQQHAATFFAQAENTADADLPQFVTGEFDAFQECGILARGVLRPRCGDRGPDKQPCSAVSGVPRGRKKVV